MNLYFFINNNHLKMETTSSFYSNDKSTSSMIESQSLVDPQDKSRFHSLIGIGAPIVDIIAEVDKEVSKNIN